MISRKKACKAKAKKPNRLRVLIERIECESHISNYKHRICVSGILARLQSISIVSQNIIHKKEIQRTSSTFVLLFFTHTHTHTNNGIHYRDIAIVCKTVYRFEAAKNCLT